MDTTTDICYLLFLHMHTVILYVLPKNSFFFLVDFIYSDSATLSSTSEFVSYQSVLTYSQPTGEVSHDTQDADTKISHLIYLGSVYVCQSLFISLPSTHLYTLGAPAERIGDTDTWLLHLLFLQIWLFCCNVYSYSPPISTQLCVNVTLPQSFLLGAANLEFVQLRCQWSITQIQHNNKS